MKNTIANRIEDFIRHFPPFDLLTFPERMEISTNVSVLYFEKNATIYKQNDNLKDHFFIINKGSVALKKTVNEIEEILNKHDEGDVFGLRPIFAKENYALSAIADEECVIYAIPISIFRPMAEKNVSVGNYLIESFASNTENPFSKVYGQSLFGDVKNFNDPITEVLFELQPASYIKKVITAKPDDSIKKIAKLMSKHNIGSLIIAENEIPLGIITDKDLRNHVVTGEFKIDEAAEKIMSSPVLCYPNNISIAQAQITMMKHHVSHLCITKDGTPNSKILGILSQNDIIVKKGSNPAILMKAISRTTSTKQLRKLRQKIMVLLQGYIEQNIPITLTSRIIFELNDATIKHIIKRCIKKMGSPPPSNFAWMSLGSQGRKEQLLHTDQDNSIIFENVGDNNLEETRTYFVNLAKKVNKRLAVVGFELCPGEMMAKNPNYCLSLDEWKQQFNQWTTETGADEILLCSIFFDFDITYGDSRLTDALAEHTFKITKDNNIFLTKLAASALRNPSPMGFFRQFLLERDGEHKNFFDLKKRGLMPIIDAGRVLALNYQIKNINNTAERFEKLAEIQPENSELYLSCSYAAKALLKFRTKHGLINNDNGRFIKLENLTKEEKMKLKRCFKTISNIQDLIKIKFNTHAFS